MAAKKKIAVNRAPTAKPKPSPKPTTAATAKPAKPPLFGGPEVAPA